VGDGGEEVTGSILTRHAKEYVPGDVLDVDGETMEVTEVTPHGVKVNPHHTFGPGPGRRAHRYRDRKLAAMLKVEARLANQRRQLRLMEQNQDRLIPTSGPGRRRAKAHRNRGLCLASAPYGYCQRPAETGAPFCDAHSIAVTG
jgi:hypothetical protein